MNSPPSDTLPEPLAGLVRDHEHAAEVVAEARATLARAAQYGLDVEGEGAVVEAVGDLERFLRRELTLHIAKEEQVLFPALRALARDTSRTVDEMIVQHDEIRTRRALLEQTMAALDAHHGTIEDERDAVVAGLHETAGVLSADVLSALLERVTRLDWILQGHFGDEEDDLFAPAAVLLAPEVLQALEADMAALEHTLPPA